MPEFLSPGHYRSERAPQVMVIGGESVSTGVIVGVFERGPIGQARLCTSLTEARERFGGSIPGSYAPIAVEGAYRNRPGMRLYIVRTVHYTDPGDPATATALASTFEIPDRHATAPVDTLKVEAVNPGTWGDRLAIVISDATLDPANKFRLVVKLDGVVKEVWDELSMLDSSADYVETRINGKSRWIKVADLDSATTPPLDRPAIGTYPLAGGDDGLTSLTDNDFLGSPAGRTGLHALDAIPEALNIAIPGRTSATLQNGLLEYAGARGDAFAVLDPPMSADRDAIIDHVGTTGAFNSEYGVIYWPNVIVADPVTGSHKIVPPSGHALGVYARIDAIPNLGPWQTPAGVEYGQLYGVLGVEDDTVNDKAVRDAIYPHNINPIRAMSRFGRVLYGARLLANAGKVRFINERRTLMYIQKSIEEDTQWVEFQNNDARLWARLTRSINSFLLRVWRAGGLRGNTPEEAFIVKIDRETNPDPESSTVKGEIGLALHTPTEFVWFEYSKHVLEQPVTPDTVAQA